MLKYYYTSLTYYHICENETPCQTSVTVFLVPDLVMKPAVAPGCRTGPPSYK